MFVFEILTESSDNEDDDEEEEEEDIQEPEASSNKNGETGNDSETDICKNSDRTENHDRVEDETWWVYKELGLNSACLKDGISSEWLFPCTGFVYNLNEIEGNIRCLKRLRSLDHLRQMWHWWNKITNILVVSI